MTRRRNAIGVLTLCLLLGACGPEAIDPDYRAVVDDLVRPELNYNLTDEQLIDAAHRSCDVLQPDEARAFETLDEATEAVAVLLAIDSAAAHVIALAGAYTYCEDQIPPGVLGPAS